jgi:glutamate racemase
MPATVGIFDSGVGGLTVADALHRLLPALPLRYVADTACFPYGERSEEAVQERSMKVARRLVAEGCSLLVVACNTASSAALERLRAELDVPIVGMEPPLKPAVEHTRTGRVAVLVTPGTARGDRLARLQDDHAGDVEVEMVPMPGLADLVEHGDIAGPAVERAVGDGLADPLRRGVDAIALGCTHYGFLRPVIERLAGQDVEVIDAAGPVARRVHQQLEAHDLPHDGKAGEAAIACSVTGDAGAFAGAVARLREDGASLPELRILNGAWA